MQISIKIKVEQWAIVANKPWRKKNTFAYIQLESLTTPICMEHIYFFCFIPLA